MKICIVGPGGTSVIPPVGWGAVEILIYDLMTSLKSLGHEVRIVNEPRVQDMISIVNSEDFDIVHIQYDDRVDMIPYLNCKNIAITNHYAYLEQLDIWAYPAAPQVAWSGIFRNIAQSRAHIMCLSPGIASIYRSAGVQDSRIHVIKNGVRNDLFRFTKDPMHPDRSIYLAKIDYRKRQHTFQDVDKLFFVGNIADDRFDSTHQRYLGEWDKQTLYSSLTDYANLALLSDGEAHPLVCLEALSAGLGLVLSERATANLDTSLPFIDVVPEDRISDSSYITSVLQRNRDISVPCRAEIREYVLSFSWESIARDLYIPCYASIIRDNAK
ncbi:hypothetical protein CMI47_02420 [Candidatus Pacearchaeota archaeon]|jgi:glycosyltransferase involved in cell wall biosynthesis|nr:hypothetical protein [Candidatus Pacearchaeota archaeon]|tara:strand:+ start:1864 stop:2844 length:981 start_codon:yes stop_codon:yes gene_type:complete